MCAEREQSVAARLETLRPPGRLASGFAPRTSLWPAVASNRTRGSEARDLLAQVYTKKRANSEASRHPISKTPNPCSTAVKKGRQPGPLRRRRWPDRTAALLRLPTAHSWARKSVLTCAKWGDACQ